MMVTDGNTVWRVLVAGGVEKHKSAGGHQRGIFKCQEECLKEVSFKKPQGRGKRDVLPT